MSFSFSLVWKTLPQFLPGIWLTIQLLVLSVIIGFVLATILALMKNSKSKLFNIPAKAFILYFRGTPFLVQLFLIYYGSGQFDLIKNSWMWEFFKEPYFCALLGLVCNNASYAGEIIYNGIITTDKGEIEAAKSFGMTWYQRTRQIILPSALRRVIPAYGNEVIFMLHATSLVSVIAMVDITGVARLIQQRYYASESFIVAGVFYLLLTQLIVYLIKRLENRYHRHLVA